MPRHIVLAALCMVLTACAPDAPVVVRGVDLHPSPEITIMRAADDYERGLLLEKKWDGKDWVPITPSSEGSSLDRMIEFFCKYTEAPISGIRGRELLPKGTYTLDFHGRVWTDRTKILPDVLAALSQAFSLRISLQEEGTNRIVVVAPQ